VTTVDLPHVFTCDNFRDVAALKLEPQFENYMGEAFKPLGVCLDFWQPTVTAGTNRVYRVTLVNDTYEPARGRLTLAWQRESGGIVGAQAEQSFDVAPVGLSCLEIELAAPAREGRYVLTGTALWAGKSFSPTLSRRQVAVTKSDSQEPLPTQ